MAIQGAIFRTAATTRQPADLAPIGFYERFLLGATPTLNLPFCRDPVRDPVEILGPDKNNRASLECVAWIGASIVLANTGRKIVSSCTSNIERAVRAAKHVNIYTHSTHPSRLASPAPPPASKTHF